MTKTNQHLKVDFGSLALSLCGIFLGLPGQFISVTYLRQTGGKLAVSLFCLGPRDPKLIGRD